MSRKESRLYVTHSLSLGEVISFEKDHAHYLQHVMRLGVGDHLLVFAKDQGEWRGVLTRVDKKGVSLEIMCQTRPPAHTPFLGLAFTPLRPNRLSFLIEKATELGVSDLFPVLTRFTSVRQVNEARLLAIAVEAAEQCERLDVPCIHPLQDIGTFVGAVSQNQGILLCDEHRDDTLLWHHIGTFKKDPILLIGPEGGFEEGELARLKNHPLVTPVSLGPQVLRAETAALAGLSLFHGRPALSL
jgi:16S rRNA (uracil1498-N3)-methyltransferase